MNVRDYDYIEARLIAPASDLLDAIERMRLVGMDAEADHLLSAMQTLIDVCRATRASLGVRGAS